MADTLTELFTDIADAVRNKTGDKEKIIAENFADEINKIPTGGSTKQSKIYFCQGSTCFDRFDNQQIVFDRRGFVNYFDESETMSPDAIIKAIIFTSVWAADEPCVGVYLFDNDQGLCLTRIYSSYNGLLIDDGDYFLMEVDGDYTIINAIDGQFANVGYIYNGDTYIIVEEDT